MTTSIIDNDQLVDGQIPPELLQGDVTNLVLSRCESLIQLPENLPAKIIRLNLGSCTPLEPTPELLAQLDEIERDNANANIQRPVTGQVKNHGPMKLNLNYKQ